MSIHLNKESDLIKQCNRALKKLKELNKLEFRRIHVGGIPTHSGYGRRTNPQKGMLDFMVCANNKVGWVECKGPDGTLSPEQKEFIKLQMMHGSQSITVIDDIDGLFKFLREDLGVYV